MGTIAVLAPVNNETPAIMTSITEDARYTIIDAGFSIPSNTVMRITKTPIKDKARPSIIHSIARIRLLSIDIRPKPIIISFVGIAI